MLGAVKALSTTRLLLCGKELSMSYANYHDDMSGVEFEDWFENKLTANLPKERKVVVVMNSAKDRCRFIEKAPTMNMGKGEMIAVMSKHDIEIPNPVPTKSVLLEKILTILKIIEQYVIDSMAEKAGLPPYHCILNPIELAWNRLKYHVCHLNVYTSKPSKVADLIRYVCKENVCTENWC